MYGRAFESMYDGSMYGAGVAVFAVWGYVIAKGKHGIIELNPKKLADTLGGTMQQIESAIEFLEKPDDHSRFKPEEGRRLVREGQFQFRVPSWEKYERIRNDEQRREYNREKQAEYRLANLIKSGGELDPSKLTAKQRAVWERAKLRSEKKILKKIERDGEIAGATKAVLTSLAVSQHDLDVGNALAEQHAAENGNGHASAEDLPEGLQ